MTMTRKLREQATRQLRVELAFSQPANAIGLQRRREEGEGEKEKIYMIKSNQTTSWSPPFQNGGCTAYPLDEAEQDRPDRALHRVPC